MSNRKQCAVAYVTVMLALATVGLVFWLTVTKPRTDWNNNAAKHSSIEVVKPVKAATGRVEKTPCHCEDAVCLMCNQVKEELHVLFSYTVDGTAYFGFWPLPENEKRCCAVPCELQSWSTDCCPGYCTGMNLCKVDFARNCTGQLFQRDVAHLYYQRSNHSDFRYALHDTASSVVVICLSISGLLFCICQVALLRRYLNQTSPVQARN